MAEYELPEVVTVSMTNNILPSFNILSSLYFEEYSSFVDMEPLPIIRQVLEYLREAREIKNYRIVENYRIVDISRWDLDNHYRVTVEVQPTYSLRFYRLYILYKINDPVEGIIAGFTSEIERIRNINDVS
jgi:hypothetical protein